MQSLNIATLFASPEIAEIFAKMIKAKTHGFTEASVNSLSKPKKVLFDAFVKKYNFVENDIIIESQKKEGLRPVIISFLLKAEGGQKNVERFEKFEKEQEAINKILESVDATVAIQNYNRNIG